MVKAADMATIMFIVDGRGGIARLTDKRPEWPSGDRNTA